MRKREEESWRLLHKMEITIEKLKKFKKGDKIKINNEEYLVEELKNEAYYNEEKKETIACKEIILTKVGEKPKVLLKQKYILRYDKKTKEIRFFREEQEKENFPNGFKFKSRGQMFSYKEVKI